MFAHNKNYGGLVALFCVLTLVLAACGQDETPDAVDVGGLDATPTLVSQTDAVIIETVEVETESTEDVAVGTVDESDAVTGAVSANVSVITGTELITSTEITTDVVVQTETLVLEQQLITTVITATDLVTDVTSVMDQSTQSESETITDTASLTPVAAEGAAVAEVAVTPLPPTPTPTILVQLTRVVTETALVTETVPTTVTATPPPRTPTPTVVVQLTRVVTDTAMVTDTLTITAVATPGAEAADVDAAALVFIGIQGAEENLIRASTLLDYDFQNVDGAVSGEIEDLLIDTKTGQILYATLEYGGFLDIGDTELPVPLNAFVWGPQGDLLLNFEEERLQEFPDLGQEWPNIADPTWDDEVVNFWNTSGIDPGFDATEASDTIVRASDLINFNVTDMGYGEGTVEDMLIDLGEGRAKYVLLSFPDANLFNGEWAAVPFNVFDASGFANGQFAFSQNFDADMLQQAPRFNEGGSDDGTGIFNTDLDSDWDHFWNDAGFWVSGAQ